MGSLLARLKDENIRLILLVTLFINAGFILVSTFAFSLISNRRNLNESVDHFSYTRGIHDLGDMLFLFNIALGIVLSIYALYIQRQKKKHL